MKFRFSFLTTILVFLITGCESNESKSVKRPESRARPETSVSKNKKTESFKKSELKSNNISPSQIDTKSKVLTELSQNLISKKLNARKLIQLSEESSDQ